MDTTMLRQFGDFWIAAPIPEVDIREALEQVSALVNCGMDYKDAVWDTAIDLLLDFSELREAFESQGEG
jgi:hypothetical protein